jgi:hypothetical protein
MDFKRTAIVIIFLEIAMAVLAYFNYDYSLEGLQALTRYSGRLSLGVFSILFLLLPDRADLLSRILSTRPFHVFALTHGIHLIILLTYNGLSGNQLIPLRIAGGFIAYVIIFAMPHLHIRQERGLISLTQFKIYLSTYLYFTWFIFFMTYLPRVQGQVTQVGGRYWEFVALLSWVCIMMGMKLPALLFKQTRSRPK